MARIQNVSVRDIASACAVSAMTVSRVLRGANVAPETRERVMAAVARLGYRPHPYVNAFMTEMRRRGRQRRVTANIAWLCGARPLREWKTVPSWAGYLRGAQEAAATLGYALTLIEDKDDAMTGQRLTNILRARGVRGIILPPLTDELDPPVDFNEFSFVRIGGKWAGVAWHKVMPDYAINQHIIWRELRRRGLKRIGLFVTSEHLVESQGNTLSGFLFNQQLAVAKQRIPPCVADPSAAMPAVFRRWYAEHRPEVVVTNCTEVRDWVGDAANGTGGPKNGASFLVHVALAAESRAWAGIDLQPQNQGRCAVEMLNGLVLRNETGPPVSQQKVLLAGRWCDGATLPAPGGPAAAADPDFLLPHWYQQWSRATREDNA